MKMENLGSFNEWTRLCSILVKGVYAEWSVLKIWDEVYPDGQCFWCVRFLGTGGCKTRDRNAWLRMYIFPSEEQRFPQVLIRLTPL